MSWHDRHIRAGYLSTLVAWMIAIATWIIWWRL